MTAPLVWLHSEKNSPSYGTERVKIWDAKVPSRNGVGIYAARLKENLPILPVEEEGAGQLDSQRKLRSEGNSSSGAGIT